MRAADVPGDVFEIAQQRPRHADGDVSAERIALSVERGDERLIEEAELAHREAETVAIRATLAPLARRQKAVAADVRVAVLEVREAATGVAAADDDRHFVRRLDDESHAVGAVARGAYGDRGQVGLRTDDARELGQPTVRAALAHMGEKERPYRPLASRARLEDEALDRAPHG